MHYLLKIQKKLLACLAILCINVAAGQTLPLTETVLNLLAGDCEVEVAVTSPTCISAIDGKAVATVTENGSIIDSDEFYFIWSNGEQGVGHNVLTGLIPFDYAVLALRISELEDINDILGGAGLGGLFGSLPIATECRLMYKEFTVTPSTLPECPFDTSKFCTFTAQLTAEPADCPTSFNGSLTLNLAGGKPPYRVLWNDGSTSSQRIVGPGFYEVQAIDDLGQVLRGGINVSSGGVNNCVTPIPAFDLIEEVFEAVKGLLGIFPVETIPIVGETIDSLIFVTDPPTQNDCNYFSRLKWSNPTDIGTSDGFIAYTQTSSSGNQVQYTWSDGTLGIDERDDLNVGPFIVNGADQFCLSFGSVVLLPGCALVTETFCASNNLFEASGAFDPPPSTLTGCDGTAKVTVTKGSGNYIYQWLQDPTNVTNQLENACIIPYQVKVIDANFGCDTIINISPDTLCTDTFFVDAQLDKAPNFAQCNGQASVVFTEINGPFQYLWSNGETTKDASNLCAGINIVTVYRPLSTCIGIDTVLINQNPCDSIFNQFGIDFNCSPIEGDTICIPCNELPIPMEQCEALCTYYTSLGAVCIADEDCANTCEYLNDFFGTNFDCDLFPPDTVCLPCTELGLSTVQCNAACDFITARGLACKIDACDPQSLCDELTAMLGLDIDCTGDTIPIPCLGLAPALCDSACALVEAMGKVCKPQEDPCESLRALLSDETLDCTGDTIPIPCLGLAPALCDSACALVEAMGKVCKPQEDPCESLRALLSDEMLDCTGDTIPIPCLGLAPALCDSACALVEAMGKVCKPQEDPCESLRALLSDETLDCTGDTIPIPCLGLAPALCDSACALVEAMGKVCKPLNLCDSLLTTLDLNSGDTLYCSELENEFVGFENFEDLCSALSSCGIECVNDCDDDEATLCDSLLTSLGLNSGDTLYCSELENEFIGFENFEDLCSALSSCGFECVNDCDDDDDGGGCYLFPKVEAETCDGGCDGSVEIDVFKDNVNVDPNEYYFVYSTGDNGMGLNTLANLCAGTYRVSVFDWNLIATNGAIDTSMIGSCGVFYTDFVISGNDSECFCEGDGCEVNVRASTSSASCLNIPDGRIAVSVSDGCSPFSILWNDGNTGFNRSVLPGSYSAVVTDAVGFTTRISVWVSADSECIVANPDEETEITVDFSQIFAQIFPGIDNIGLGNQVIDNLYRSVSDSINNLFLNNANFFCEQQTDLSIRFPSNVLAQDGIIRYSVATINQPQSYLWNDGSTVPDRPNLGVGDYVVSSRDTTGCFSQAAVLMTPACPEELSCEDFLAEGDFTVGISPDLCENIAKVDISGGSGRYLIDWLSNSPIDNQVNFREVCYQEVSVRIIDTILNCDTLIVIPPDSLRNCQNPEFSVRAYQIAPETSALSCDAMAKVDIMQGSGSYNIVWSDGSRDAIADSLCGGLLYIATVYDSMRMCTASDTVFIKSCLGNSNINADVMTTNNTAAVLNPDTCNGSASVVFNDGSLPSTYFYSWKVIISNGVINTNLPETGSSINGLCAGLYSVTVRERGGSCDTTIFFTVGTNFVCTNPFSVTISEVASSYPTMCDGLLSAVAEGGSGQYQYRWTSANSLFFDNQNDSVSNVCGRSPISLNIVDVATGCTFDTTFISASCSRLSVDLKYVDIPVCPDSCDASIVAEPFGFTPPLTYFWDGSLLPSIRPTQNDLCFGQTKTVRVLDRFLCEATDTLLIDETENTNCCSMFSFSIDTLLLPGCNGAMCNGSVEILPTGSGPFQIIWLNDSLENVFQRDDLCADSIYAIEISNPDGCVYVDTLILPKNTACCEKITLSNDSFYVCSVDQRFTLGNFVALTGGQEFSWIPTQGVDNPNSGRTVINPRQTTEYTVYVYNKFCGDSTVRSVKVNVEVEPALDFSIYPSDSVLCDSTFQNLPVGVMFNSLVDNPEEISYFWTPFDSYTDNTSKETFLNVTDSVFNGGVIINYGRNGSCRESKPFLIKQSTQTDNVFIPDTIYYCATDINADGTVVAELTASGGVGYCWKNQANDDNCFSSDRNVKISVPSGLVSRYFVDVVTAEGCVVSDDVFLVAEPEPNVNVEITKTNCESDSIRLVATGANQFEWVSPKFGFTCTTCSDTWFVSPAIDSITFVVKGYNNFCYTLDTISTGKYLDDADNLLADLNFDVLYDECNISFEANFDSFANYEWDFGDGIFVENTSGQIQHFYTNPGKYLVRLKVTTACYEKTVEKYIDVEFDDCLCAQ